MSEVARLQTGNTAFLQSAGASLPELFVINLCASMTPMPAVPKTLKGFEKYKLYQVSRQEDGRRRFRLRLGFFTSEADAEWVLNSVRSLYPAAFTGCLSQEDLRHAGDALPPAPAAVARAVEPVVELAKPAPQAAAANVTPGAVKPTVKAEPPVAAKPRPELSALSTPAVGKPAAMATPAPTPNQDLTLSSPPAAVAPAPSLSAPTFHVGRGIDIPETHLELTDEYQVVSAPIPVPSPAKATRPVPASSQPAAAATSAQKTAPATAKGPVHSAVIINPPKIVDDYVPILDTTLTIRTLTKTEADDPNRPKWFVVQLALSEQPINLDTMPKLDIFAAYRLYSVALMEGGGIRHALRLGFFRENVSAEAVMGYLKAFFPAPGISQISAAEYDRFAEPKPRAKPVEAEAKVVNLQDKRTAPVTTATAPATGSAKPAATSSAARPKTSAAKRVPAPAPRPQSFLSRLIGRQLD